MVPDGPAGTFFHPVPEDDDDDDDDYDESVNENATTEANISMESLLASLSLKAVPSSEEDNNNDQPEDAQDATTATPKNVVDEFDDAISKLIQQRRKKPLASQPSTINGIPTQGFGKNKKNNNNASTNVTKKSSPKKPYTAIGPKGVVAANPSPPRGPINDPSRPQLDDQGYTLYTNEETGETSRVFEALVDYPCVFTMKIVGANEGTFVQDILAVVADATQSSVSDISHSTKAVGKKWTSVTVQAPVQSSEMLYTLYEKVDLDPRVKFKF